jgi:hypothetical protein
LTDKTPETSKNGRLGRAIALAEPLCQETTQQTLKHPRNVGFHSSAWCASMVGKPDRSASATQPTEKRFVRQSGLGSQLHHSPFIIQTKIVLSIRQKFSRYLSSSEIIYMLDREKLENQIFDKIQPHHHQLPRQLQQK